MSLLVYSLPGAGKTTLACSAPNTVIIRPPTDHIPGAVDLDNVGEMVVQDWDDMNRAFQYAQQKGSQHDWFWLDTISQFQEFGLDDVFGAAVMRKQERAQFGPDKGEYGINMTRLSTWVRNMVGLANSGAFNFGVTAHVMEGHDPVADADFWQPLVAGKNMSPKVCGYMNIVAYYQHVQKEEGPDQRLLLTDTPGFVGKDQLNCFPELKSGRHGFVNPTMEDVTAAVQGTRPAPARKRKAAGKTKRPARRRTRS